jgi:histidyl-tRNA synthetase
MANKTYQPLKGFRDLLPAQMAIRNRVIKTLSKVFESYGFEPLQTPTLEYAETLTGKYGDEADKLMYLFEDQGKRKVGLNYDLTVPTARVLAQYQDLPRPFRRYQIQSAYRAENTQAGRYRQLTQCDVDIFGSKSPAADAEIISIIATSLKALRFKEFQIKVNSRQVLFKLIEDAKISEAKKFTVIQSIDKLDKKTEAEVKAELAKKEISKDQIESLFLSLKNLKPDEYLNQVITLAQEMGVKKDQIVFEPFLARGLDYYNGPIFETVVTKPKIGSITGGGRYDGLIEQLGGPNTPAVGTSLGLDRICDVIEENNLWPELPPVTKILITNIDSALQEETLKAASILRTAGINTESYPDSDTPLPKQLKYANKKKIPFVLIVGENEAKNNQVTLKNMITGDQKTETLKEIISTIK